MQKFLDKILYDAKQLNKINDNSYFIKLKNNVKLDKFLISQECFITAVSEWSNILILLLEKLHTVEERAIIIENLYDEYGSGNIEKSHVYTFTAFLKSLNYNQEIKIHNKDLPSYKYVNEFINELKSHIRNNNQIFYIGMLAMIEYTYINVSANIHNYVSNFINSDEINHYSTHEIIDTKHSMDLFKLIAPYTNNHKDIQEGMMCGYEIIFNLYSQLSIFLD